MRRADEEAPRGSRSDREQDGARQIRGSILFVAGRGCAKLATGAAQVLLARHLSKSDYGAIAYGLSAVALSQGFITLGLQRAITRYLPVYEDRGEYGKVLGTIAIAFGTILSLGLLVVALAHAFRGAIGGVLVNDRRVVPILLILIALAPIDGLERVMDGLFAVLSRPGAIFVRKHVLGPVLKLLVIVLLIARDADVRFLAMGYVMAGVVGIAFYGGLLVRILRIEETFTSRLRRARMELPFREVAAFTVPLFITGVTALVMNSVDAIVLERFRGTAEVANLRAVQPLARLNQIVAMSFGLLFAPVASRFFARGEADQLDRLYWRTTVWIAAMTFPVFALTSAFAEPTTLMLYGSRYEGSVAVLIILSIGQYFNAALGLNLVVLTVARIMTYLIVIDVVAVVMNVSALVVLTPRFGALGAAIASTATVIVFNLMVQAGFMRGTGVTFFDRRYIMFWGAIVAGVSSLAILQAAFHPSMVVAVLLTGVVSVVVVFVTRSWLRIGDVFPELRRIPVVRLLAEEEDD